MKLTLLLITFIISVNLFAQTRECISIDRNKNLVEHYYALQADTQIKEGRYVAYTFFTNRIICKGFYKNNLKDSIWSYYAGNKIADSGRYSQDKKAGVWQGYKHDGSLQLQYDYTAKKLISYSPDPQDTSIMYKIIDGATFSMALLDRPPIYMDGDLMAQMLMVNNIRYPQQAREANIQGKVIVGFTINEDGHVSDYKVIRSIGHGLDEAALDAVKHITGAWLPGLLKGKPVAVEHMVPVSFSLAM